MTAATLPQTNTDRAAEADVRRMEVLRFIRRRFNTTEMLMHRTGLHERTVQRYTAALEVRGLIRRVVEPDGKNWRHRYQMTDDGMRALSG